MKITRREFVLTGLAGTAGLYLGGYAAKGGPTESHTQLPDEDGYKQNFSKRQIPPLNLPG